MAHRNSLTSEWQMIDEVVNALERPIIAEMNLIFDEQLMEAEQAISAARSAAYETRKGILSIDTIFDFAKWIGATWDRLRQFAINAFLAGYETGQAQMDLELVDLDMFDPEIRDLMETMAEKSRSISVTTRDKLKDIVDESLLNEWTPEQTTEAIRAKFDDFKGSRPKLIAQTMATAAFGRAQLKAFNDAGFDKGWISRRDERVRDTHVRADGQEQPSGDPFVVGQALLMHPADPDTDRLEEIMGCRCYMYPVARN